MTRLPRITGREVVTALRKAGFEVARINEIRAVELVRRIRDEQAASLAGKSDAEVIEFFRQADQAAREEALKRAVRRAQRPGTRDARPGR